MIYPSIRAIAVGFDDKKKITVRYYLDRAPAEEDYENLSMVMAEVLADIDFEEAEEQCVYSDASLSELDPLELFVYMRQEQKYT